MSRIFPHRSTNSFSMSAQPFEYGQGKNRPKFSHPRKPVTTGQPSAFAAFAFEPLTISSMSRCGLPANAGSSTAW
ncbi:MAG: hypothetical protein NTU62_06130 [Spirochaetes bacterium]|nr:hypothetical protein [Spirochaetota bacterium]